MIDLATPDTAADFYAGLLAIATFFFFLATAYSVNQNRKQIKNQEFEIADKNINANIHLFDQQNRLYYVPRLKTFNQIKAVRLELTKLSQKYGETADPSLQKEIYDLYILKITELSGILSALTDDNFVNSYLDDVYINNKTDVEKPVEYYCVRFQHLFQTKITSFLAANASNKNYLLPAESEWKEMDALIEEAIERCTHYIDLGKLKMSQSYKMLKNMHGISEESLKTLPSKYRNIDQFETVPDDVLPIENVEMDEEKIEDDVNELKS